MRYEDFAAAPSNHAPVILPFLGFNVDKEVRAFLKEHTKSNKGGVSSTFRFVFGLCFPFFRGLYALNLTFRDSRTAPYHWKQDLNFSEVNDIQSKCAKAMDLWGYKMYRSEAEMKNSDLFDSKLPLNWTHSELLI